MTIARQAQKQAKGKPKAKLVDVTGKHIYKAEGPKKHFNFMPKSRENARGGLYAE